jgi:hypothetical protein
MVEGYRTTFADDEPKYAIEIAQYLSCLNSNGPNPFLGQPFVSMQIRAGNFARIVDGTTYLDAQTRSVAIEVQHVRAGRMLAPKLQSVRTLP